MRRRLSSPHRFAAMFLRGLLTASLLTSLVLVSWCQETLNNQSVIDMAKALGEDTVLEMMKQKKSAFATATEDLVVLKRAGVSDKIIVAMLNKNLAEQKAEPPKPKIPVDEGVYYKKAGAWVEVLSETIVWNNSGMVNTVRSMASAGMLKRDYSGTIEQASSHTMLTSPFELLIVCKTSDILNYLLIPLKADKISREVDMGPAKKGEAFKHAISYGVEKLGNGQFKMFFPTPLSPGEYGIVERSNIATENRALPKNDGRIYTFRVLL